MPAADLGIRPRLFYGWIVVATAFLVLFMAYGTQYAFGVFLAALGEEFGWSRASLSGVFSLYAFVYSVFALGAGRLTDRWGPRAVISVGGALLGIGLMLMSRVTALWQPYRLCGTVAALGMSTAYIPCNATVAKWFTRRRGIAVGLASAGGSLGTFALPPVAHLLVSHLGWRGAYVVFGAAVLVALNGLAVLMRRDPETMGLRPDGAPASPRPLAPASVRVGGRWQGAAHPRVLDALRRLRGHVDAGVHPARAPGAHGPRARHRAAAGRHAGQRGRGRRDGGTPGDGRGLGPDRAACRPRGGLRPAGRRLHVLLVVERARRPLRGLRRLRLLLRGRVHALHRHRRRLLRPRARGEPRRAALLAGRLDGRVRAVRGRLHLRSRRRLPLRLVAQRGLQRARVEPARVHAPAAPREETAA
jgi:hypothetical protein